MKRIVKIFNNTREVQNKISADRKIFEITASLVLGICLGVFSKYLDYRQAELPYILAKINDIFDLSNFFGGFAPWILAAVCISVYSSSPYMSAVKVFLFFLGMVGSYYLYCNFVAGFFPKSYAMIWFVFTAVSPILAFFCWYAKGNGILAVIISSCIISVLINTAFFYGIWYLSISSILNVVMLAVSLIVLKRTPKETAVMLIISVVLAAACDNLLPYHIW